MDWSNENWVRVYTRDTEDDLVLPWQARAVWKEMMCKFDRSGLIELKRGRAGLAALIRYPIEVVDVAIPELIADGRVREIVNGYFAPNFMEAQEAPASDKYRKRESREKRRARSESSSAGQTVTFRDRHGVIDTEPVTFCDRMSADPLHRSLLPNLTSDQERSPDLVQVRPEPPDPSTAVRVERDQVRTPPPGIPAPGGGDQRVRLNHDAWRYAAMEHVRLREMGLSPGAVLWPPMPAGVAQSDLVARTREVLSQTDPPDFEAARALIKRRVDVAAAEAMREGHLNWFTPMKIWDERGFWRATEITPEEAAKPRAPPRGTNVAREEPIRRIKNL